MKVQQLIVLTGLAIFLTSVSLFTPENDAFAIEFSNYTSEEYGIQFEYPEGWYVDIDEKTSRFDTSGNKIDITSNSGSGTFFSIMYDDNFQSFYGTSDLLEATEKVFQYSKIQLLGNNPITIESPSFITIDNQTAGTFLIMATQTYSPITFGMQNWIVSSNGHGYGIVFSSPTSEFDSSENTEIRNHFINSIKFN